MSATMAKQFGDFLGSFIEYDKVVLTFGVQKFIRIKVSMDVLQPLKIRKKIIFAENCVFYAQFQYEN